MIPRGDSDIQHSTEMPFHSIAIRILSSYMQVSGMLLAFDLYIPSQVRSLISAQSAVSSLGEQLLMFDCLVQSREDSTLFFMKQVFAAWIMPLSACSIIAMFWLLRHLICQRDGNDDEEHILRIVESKRKAAKGKRGTVGEKEGPGKVREMDTPDKLDMIRETIVFVPSVDGFITTIVVLFYTLYPSLVNRMALTFSCVSWDEGETDVLTEALSVKCWTPEHMALIYQVGVPGSLLYMFVVPVLISVTLTHQRKRQRLYPHQKKYAPMWTMRFSFMFAGYREGFEWWESVVMARKCLFVLMAIFLRLYGPIAQVIASAIVLSLAISLHLQYRPYFDQGLNWLESVSLQMSLAQLLTATLANVLTHGRANAGGKPVSSTSKMGPKASVVKGTGNLFLKFFNAMERGLGEVKVQSLEEKHDKSLGAHDKRVAVRSKRSHQRLEKRLATRKSYHQSSARKALGSATAKPMQPASVVVPAEGLQTAPKTK
eukprot:g1526.t1